MTSGRVRLVRSDSLAGNVEYAYAAVTPAGAPLTFLAGACPLDQDGSVVGGEDYAAQARQCLRNMLTALQSAGVGLDDVVYTRVLVASTAREDLVSAWREVRSFFGDHDAPSTLSGVTVLGYPGQLVEIEAVASEQLRTPGHGQP